MRSSLRFVLAPVLAAALLVAPRIALACSVCTGGQKEEVGTAFLVGSIFLSVLPLAAIGAVVWWLRRRARTLTDGAAALSASPR
jgi:membrane protein DedA with SNARE-associated domain